MTKGTRVYSKTIDGETVTMLAHSAADQVRYTYDGWRDITDDVEAAQKVAKEIADGAARPATAARK